MTQLQKTAPRALLACPDGHPARYIHDLRREGAGGGHLIECRCSTTAKHPTFDLAWAYIFVFRGVPVSYTHLTLPTTPYV